MDEKEPKDPNDPDTKMDDPDDDGQPSLAHRPQASAIPEGPTPPPFNKDDGTTLFLRPTFLSSPPEGSVRV